MKIRSAILSVLCHGAAGVFSAGFLILVAIATYFICAAIGNDAGGPMVILLIPLIIFIGGIGTTLFIYFPFFILFGWLARRRWVSFWISPLVFFAMAFLFFLGWLMITAPDFPSFSDLGLAVLCGLFFTGGFLFYWLGLAVGKRLLRHYENVA